jgi:hypothetical protein
MAVLPGNVGRSARATRRPVIVPEHLVAHRMRERVGTGRVDPHGRLPRLTARQWCPRRRHRGRSPAAARPMRPAHLSRPLCSLSSGVGDASGGLISAESFRAGAPRRRTASITRPSAAARSASRLVRSPWCRRACRRAPTGQGANAGGSKRVYLRHRPARRQWIAKCGVLPEARQGAPLPGECWYRRTNFRPTDWSGDYSRAGE